MTTLATPPLAVSTEHMTPGHSRPGSGRIGAARWLQGRILFLQPVRIGEHPLAGALRDLGYQADSAAEIPPDSPQAYDLVVARRPHACPAAMESLAACSAAGIPTILDLDLDFKHLPCDHPDYESSGLKMPARARAYETALQLAETIRVPGEAFAAALRSTGKQVQVIPEGWSRSNNLWSRAAAAHHILNLGWVGSPGGLEDLRELRRTLIRVLREFPQVRMVIAGDPQADELFGSLPEGRYQVLPSPDPQDYPYLLSLIDLLVVPLRSTLFHQHSCDRRLMEAGVRSIPWIASPTPAFIEWGAGGLVAHSLEEWHTDLRQLILDPDLRMALGQAGRQRAEGRELNHLGPAWVELIKATLARKAAAGVARTVQ